LAPRLARKASRKERMNRIKNLVLSRRAQSGGRNHRGVITVFHRGGGNQKLYRIIDFKRSLFEHPAIVTRIEEDPNRTSKIALVCYKNGMLSYILAPKTLSVGDHISAGPSAELAEGNALPVGNCPIGTLIHNIELKPGRGRQLMRAAGTHAKIIKKDRAHAIVRLHSGKLYSISTQSMATIGIVSNDSHKNIKLTKAGQSR